MQLNIFSLKLNQQLVEHYFYIPLRLILSIILLFFCSHFSFLLSLHFSLYFFGKVQVSILSESQIGLAEVCTRSIVLETTNAWEQTPFLQENVVGSLFEIGIQKEGKKKLTIWVPLALRIVLFSLRPLPAIERKKTFHQVSISAQKTNIRGNEEREFSRFSLDQYFARTSIFPLSSITLPKFLRFDSRKLNCGINDGIVS